MRLKTEWNGGRFLTWRAMQFDAFESVYLAARDDPQCDVLVVAVPYYEVNPDKSLGKMHHEGAEYYFEPNYRPGIVAVDWTDCDIESRRPDAIFVNNPYDGNVRNACIHPSYLNELLRDYTDLLVYIPYFVVSNETPEHFRALPGCIYAHKFMVQSEKVRNTYVRVYKEFVKKQGLEKNYGGAEEKFIALGSPKYDKVIGMGREDCNIPPEWRKLIERPDGTAKKIVLYNTHMFAWMSEPEAYFKKIRTVFEFFRRHRDIVLWRRPHPNTEVNFKTLCPHWYPKYLKVVSEYQLQAKSDANSPDCNFIYDDTPDLHRVLALSSAYFGDAASSLVALYEQTGKPMMFQNIECGESSEGDEWDHSDAIIFGFRVLCADEFKSLIPSSTSIGIP